MRFNAANGIIPAYRTAHQSSVRHRVFANAGADPCDMAVETHRLGAVARIAFVRRAGIEAHQKCEGDRSRACSHHEIGFGSGMADLLRMDACVAHANPLLRR